MVAWNRETKCIWYRFENYENPNNFDNIKKKHTLRNYMIEKLHGEVNLNIKSCYLKQTIQTVQLVDISNWVSEWLLFVIKWVRGPSWSWSSGSWIYNYYSNQCISPLMSSNPIHGEVYLIQRYVIKFVSDLRQVSGFSGYSGFLHQQNWPPQ